MKDEVNYDFARRQRIGLSEAVLCEGKSTEQIEHIVNLAAGRGEPLLMTRLAHAAFGALPEAQRSQLDYDAVSRTAILGTVAAPSSSASVAVVSAGTSDAPVVREAVRTLAFHGEAADVIMDIGVAGLWRLLERQEQLDQYRAIIVVAGMDGAIFSVLGGLVGGVVIAVPTSTGYGAAGQGVAALQSALASCAPGIVVVNVGNGYGAACAALRVLRDQREVGR